MVLKLGVRSVAINPNVSTQGKVLVANNGVIDISTGTGNDDFSNLVNIVGSISGDYATKTYVDAADDYLQTQIDNISGGSGDNAILVGGSGIQVIESPVDTWTISVSGNYATKAKLLL